MRTNQPFSRRSKDVASYREPDQRLFRLIFTSLAVRIDPFEGRRGYKNKTGVKEYEKTFSSIHTYNRFHGPSPRLHRSRERDPDPILGAFRLFQPPGSPL